MQKKRLSISKETIKWLDDDSLEHVHAGAFKVPDTGETGGGGGDDTAEIPTTPC